jgi:Tfp pilus assembly major pilin PilA
MIGNSRQRGITLLSFLMVIAVLGFFAFIGMRLFPVYSEYYSVKQAMDAVANEPGVNTWDARRVRDALDRRFNISYVFSVKPEHIKVTRSATGNTLTIDYEVRKPFAYNLDFVARFNRSVELTRQSAE